MTNRLDPAAISPGSADGQFLQTSGGLSVWGAAPSGGVKQLDDLTDVDTSTTAPAVGDTLTWNGSDWVPGAPSTGGGSGASGVLLLEHGASVPTGTAVGTIIYQKAPSAANVQSDILADNPTCFLTMDETSGNWLDLSGNSRNHTPGAGVTRGKVPLLADGGFAASGSGTANIGSYSGATGLTANGWSMECLAKIPSGNFLGGFMKFGTSGNGVALGIGAASGDGSPGRMLILGQNGISYRNFTWSFPADGGTYHIGLTWSTVDAVTLYINGAVVGNASNWGRPNAPGNALYVGEDEGHYLSAGIDVDNVVWFPTVLSSARMALHAAGVSANTGSALGWWDGSRIAALG